MTTKYDEQRKNDLVNALVKAKEKAVTAKLYLTANSGDPEDVWNVALAQEHIEIALEHLGAVSSDDRFVCYD